MIDILIFVPFITFISVLYIFAYVSGQRKKSVVNKSFLLFLFFMMIAPLVDFLIHFPLPSKVIVLFYKIIIPILLSLGFLFMNFAFTLINKKKDTKYWLCFSAVIISIISLFFLPPLTLAEYPGYRSLMPIPSVWFVPPFFVTLVLIPIYAFYVCLQHIRSEENVILVRQLRLVIFGGLLSSPATILTVLIGPLLLHNYVFLHFATLGILVNAVFMFRAIQRHFLLSINIEQIENAFNRLFENLHDSVILLDSLGIAIQINESAKKLLNANGAIITKDFLEQHISGYHYLKNDTDLHATYKDKGEIKHLQISQSQVKDNDLSLGKLIIIRDVTLQKKAEQLLVNTKSIESIGQLAGGIAHDFNNFLCAIVSNISLAKMDVDPASKTAELLALSEKTALNARDLTRQLLTFSKGDGRKIETFDIIELIIETGRFMTFGSNTIISFDLPKSSIFVKADKGQIRQVFQNIFINAMESMPQHGTIRIHGKSTFLHADSAHHKETVSFFQVSIIDQGYGISTEHLTRIFEPYFTTKPNGNGLGLAIVNSIISKCNGTISVKSQIGKGSEFIITLPITTEIPHKEPQAVIVSTIQPGRILIMDDYPTIRLSLALQLRRLGYTVDQASSGNQALELYDNIIQENGSYQAVITDLTVPGAMGGKVLAEELHKRDPGLCIIVSSGYSEEVEISQYKEFGFSAVLHKPYSPEELKEVLNSVLSPVQ